jgi:hypothetical protein
MSVCLYSWIFSPPCYIVMCDFSGRTILFQIISYTGRFSGERYLTQKVCFDFLYNICLQHYHSEKNLAIHYHKFTCLQVKCPLFLSDFHQTGIFSTGFRQTTKHQISRKSVQWEPSCSMRTDRQTNGRDDAKSFFQNFANAPKKSQKCQWLWHFNWILLTFQLNEQFWKR